MLLGELGRLRTKSFKQSQIKCLEQFKFALIQMHIYMPATNDTKMHLIQRIALGIGVNGSVRPDPDPMCTGVAGI